jgi:RNA polymerase sigma-70 factor (ECF subfamily)
MVRFLYTPAAWMEITGKPPVFRPGAGEDDRLKRRSGAFPGQTDRQLVLRRLVLMLEDRLLVWRFNRGEPSALCEIYEKYRAPLLRVGAALLNDRNGLEDVLHDVFVDFAQTTGRFRLTGSLKGYLSICVANRARDRNRTGRHHGTVSLDETTAGASSTPDPERSAAGRELTAKLDAAMADLPGEQREVVVLHLQGRLPFREIARLRDISINTAMSRYRYALEKIRSALNGEFEP